jgi:hypothetical protein
MNLKKKTQLYSSLPFMFKDEYTSVNNKVLYINFVYLQLTKNMKYDILFHLTFFFFFCSFFWYKFAFLYINNLHGTVYRSKQKKKKSSCDLLWRLFSICPYIFFHVKLFNKRWCFFVETVWLNVLLLFFKTEKKKLWYQFNLLLPAECCCMLILSLQINLL